MKKIRLIIADDHTLLRMGLTTLFKYQPDMAVVGQAENGARGAQFKGSPTDGLLAAIRAVASGETAYAPEIEKLLASTPESPALSPRQQEVLDAITRGLTNDDIAVLLKISKARVKQLTRALYAKLGAANRAEAVALALRKHP